MKKLAKAILVLSLTAMIAVIGFLAIKTANNGSESEAAITPPTPPVETEPDLQISSETTEGAEYQELLRQVLERERIERLGQRSKEARNEPYPVPMGPEMPGQESQKFSHVAQSRFHEGSRLLEDANTLSSPGIIPFNQMNSTEEYYAYQYIFRSLAEYSTDYVVYPYSFTYVPDATDITKNVAYNKGAVFSLNPTGLPTDNKVEGYFTNVKAATNVSFGKAKALYDINIAVLSIEDYYNDMLMDINYESSTYCNVLSTYLGKYTDCLVGSTGYWQFKGDSKNAGKTALVMVNGTDIVTNNLLFTADGAPRFQMLVIPDYYLGAQTVINTKLGTAGIQKIKDFVNKGGLIYASGKAGYLLELWGIVATGLYNTNTLLTSTNSYLQEPITGCADTTGMDFWSALLCMNIPASATNTRGYSFVLSAFKMNQDKATNLQVVMSYDTTSTTFKKKDTAGVITDITGTDKAFQPFTLMGSYGKGKVLLVNGNPVYKNWYNKFFYNAVMMAMSKNVVFDAYVGTKDNTPIPGGEAGILLNVVLSFMNLYDKAVNSLAVHMWFPSGLTVNSLPASCVATSTDPTFTVNLTGVNPLSHVVCSQAVIAAFSKFSAIVNVEITDQTLTQAKLGILMVAAGVEYTDSESSITYQYDVGGVRADAAAGSLLRAALNPDPSSFYPIKGRGQYVDNVLQVENKEDTKALNVEYIGIVPLISPVVDGSDQTLVSRALKFLPSYYKNESRTYYYPFKSVVGQNYDILDFMWLNNKDVTLNAEWDIPVKPLKGTRNSSFPTLPADTGSINIKNYQYTTSINSLEVTLQQTYYADSDKFFESAGQRLTVFVDTALEAGATTRYPNGIPANEVNPGNSKIAKRELIWSRSDLYFYSSNGQYQMPSNIDYTHVISVDKYKTYTGVCKAPFGSARAIKEVEGYFDVAYDDGLKANEYSNELLMHCEKTKVTLDQVKALSKGSIVPIHYLVPVTDAAILTANDIMNFTVNADGTGHLDDYPELKFIFGHYFNLVVDGAITRQGGKMVITLESGVAFIDQDTVDPVANYFISYSADQVGFYLTEYNATARTITSYFKRGLLPNEAYGKSSLLGIMLEQLNTNVKVTANVKVYEMKYDISKPEVNYEVYTLKLEKTVDILHDRFFSMPAVEVHVKMNRTGDASIAPYELLEPYTRFGVYIQELQKHRTVYAYLESHHVTDPGVSTINGGLAMISNLGISSVPFAEYVTTGAALLIPSSPSTSRIEWTDIWGRRWSQPLRSVFPDIPPIPPPLRNFIMTTTYELTKAGATDRVMSWNSDESLDIRVQLKLLNNYPKYFEITTCQDNNVTYMHSKETMFELSRIYDLPPYDYEVDSTEAPSDKYHIGFGHRSAYGMCFSEAGTVLQGAEVSAADREIMSTAYLCASTNDPTKLLACANQLAGLKTVKRRTGDSTPEKWMYSPEVERYYPENYIKSNMWDLTHYDYDDNPMDKAYKYHMDNCLPGIDYGPVQNPSRYKPHNVIAQPIYKGLGFNISYSKTQTLPRFPKYKGWWSDNLQNKDHTLVAGQAKSNSVSVSETSFLLKDTDWINARDLINPITDNVIKARLKNIHTCLFNQHRVKQSPGQQRYAYLGNVYQNNIIPIIPSLEANDARLTNYDCTGVYQYSPTNISQVDNVVYTPTNRDWLYFAANLRGGALETINVPYTMTPFSGVKIEGLVKVQDGGRFVYWNPANGPNSFLIVDNPVNVVEAVRCDLTITCEVMPKATTTFQPVLYHLLSVTDAAEVSREWTYETYTNNYGFGDATVAVFVGGTDTTTATVAPGGMTYAKITFYNNAGFDWNMIGSAIDFQYVGSQPINANDLLFMTVHSIQKPLAYNFMILNIPAEIKPYITIIPSDHNIVVAPQFFDFMNINVVQIRDGFKGDYYYKINVLSTIPEALCGRVYEIGITLNETMFDKLPGHNDPTGNYHDYNLKVPSIKFGIPYPTGTYKGKVFYTSGYSSNLAIKAYVPNYWNVQGARLIGTDLLDDLRIAAADTAEYAAKTLAVWNQLTDSGIVITSTTSGSTSTVNLDMSTPFPTFPKPNTVGPDTASFYVLMKVNATQLSYGTIRVISSPTITYKDHTSKAKSAVIPAPVDKTVASKGAWMQIGYSIKVVKQAANGTYYVAEDQRFFASDETGTVRVTMGATNIGSDTAYNVNFTAILAEGITLIESEMSKDINYTVKVLGVNSVLKLETGRSLGPGDTYSEVIHVKFVKLNRRRVLASTTSRSFIKSISADINLADSASAVQVSQSISTPLTVSVYTSDRDSVTLSATVVMTNSKPVFSVTALASPTTTSSGAAVRYLITRSIKAISCDDNTADTTANGKCSSISTSETTVKSISSTRTVTDQPIPSSFTGYVRSGLYQYTVTTYDENKVTLAVTTWSGVAQASSSSSGGSETGGNNNNNNNGGNNNNNGGTEEQKGDPIKPVDNGSSDSNDTFTSSSSSSGSYSLPTYAIVLIPTCAFVVILLAAIFIYRKYRLVKIHIEPNSQEVPVKIEDNRVMDI